MQNTIPFKLAERIHPISQRVYRQSVARKLTGAKKRTSVEVSESNSRTFSGKNNLERKTKDSFI